MSDKLYCGAGKEVGQYGRINIVVNLDEIPPEHITEDQRGRTVRLSVVRRRQPSDKGMTHYVEVDTWKPTGDAQPQPPRRSSAPPPPFPTARNDATAVPQDAFVDDDEDSLPF